tara:strand:- start:183 stop:1118 length:936 start_codon:yes stop_codon:yes gene_type:complete
MVFGDCNLIKSKAWGPGMPTNHCLANLVRERSLSISQDTFEGDSSCDFKVFLQCEPPSVINLVPQVIANQGVFDLIIAWHSDILKYCHNAVKVEFGTCSIADGFKEKEVPVFEIIHSDGSSSLDSLGDTGVSKKKVEDEISFITSDKTFTDGHQLRQRIFNLFQTTAFKRFSNSVPSINGFRIRSRRTPPRIQSVEEVYINAKFNICVENSRYENYFTEKLMNCFATKTVPIYWGAPNIGDYFNMGGIIQFSNLEDLKHILASLTPAMYEYFREGVEDNYKLYSSYVDYNTRVIKEIDKALDNPGLRSSNG